MNIEEIQHWLGLAKWPSIGIGMIPVCVLFWKIANWVIKASVAMNQDKQLRHEIDDSKDLVKELRSEKEILSKSIATLRADADANTLKTCEIECNGLLWKEYSRRGNSTGWNPSCPSCKIPIMAQNYTSHGKQVYGFRCPKCDFEIEGNKIIWPKL